MRSLAMFVFCLALFPAAALAHCQIPCGIYGDELRFQTMEEDIRTIEKSTQEIIALSKKTANALDTNQLVRWIENKDHHADKLSETVTFYFMAQRVAPVGAGGKKTYEEYVTKLTLLHRLMVLAMKSKQETNLSYPGEMRAVLKDFRAAYLAKPEG